MGPLSYGLATLDRDLCAESVLAIDLARLTTAAAEVANRERMTCSPFTALSMEEQGFEHAEVTPPPTPPGSYTLGQLVEDLRRFGEEYHRAADQIREENPITAKHSRIVLGAQVGRARACLLAIPGFAALREWALSEWDEEISFAVLRRIVDALVERSDRRLSVNAAESLSLTEAVRHLSALPDEALEEGEVRLSGNELPAPIDRETRQRIIDELERWKRILYAPPAERPTLQEHVELTVRIVAWRDRHAPQFDVNSLDEVRRILLRRAAGELTSEEDLRTVGERAARACDRIKSWLQTEEDPLAVKTTRYRPSLGGPALSSVRITVEWSEPVFAQPKWRELARNWSGTFGGTLGKPARKGDTLLVAWDGPDADALMKAAEAGDLDRGLAAVGGGWVIEIDQGGECFYQFVPEVTPPAAPAAIPTAAAKFAACTKDVDLLLVTSAKVEEDVLLGYLSPWPGEASVLRGSLSTITYELGTFGRYHAAHVLTTQGDTGREGVTSLVGTAISELRPKAIILLGIAFGVNRRKQRLGDVLVANSVFPYAFERVGLEKTVPRGTEMQCGRVLADRFRRRRRDWRMACGHRQVEVHQGQVLSGPKLIDNRTFRDELLGEYPNAVGGEMEGAGAYAAGDQAKVETILIKGICDWADGHKNDRAQPFAAAAAVSLAIHVLSQPDVLKEIGAREHESPP